MTPLSLSQRLCEAFAITLEVVRHKCSKFELGPSYPSAAEIRRRTSLSERGFDSHGTEQMCKGTESSLTSACR